MTAGLRARVRERAGARCEYCRLPDAALDLEDFHLEHIIARQHGGKTSLENLAWACLFCNLRKGRNLTGIDPDSRNLTRLFHPRRDLWEEPFQLEGSRIRGRTAVGRTTAWLLEMNAGLLCRLRASLQQEDRW